MAYTTLAEFDEVFLGACFGVGLKKERTVAWGGMPSYEHYVLKFLVEDDESWYTQEEHSSFDSFWLPDMQDVLKRVHEWVQANPLKRGDTHVRTVSGESGGSNSSSYGGGA